MDVKNKTKQKNVWALQLSYNTMLGKALCGHTTEHAQAHLISEAKQRGGLVSAWM